MVKTMNKDKQEFWEALSYPDLRDRTCQTCANSDKSGSGEPCHKTDAFEDCFADYNSYPEKQPRHWVFSSEKYKKYKKINTV